MPVALVATAEMSLSEFMVWAETDGCYSMLSVWLKWSFLKISERKTPEVAHCGFGIWPEGQDGTEKTRKRKTELELEFGFCSHRES